MRYEVNAVVELIRVRAPCTHRHTLQSNCKSYGCMLFSFSCQSGPCWCTLWGCTSTVKLKSWLPRAKHSAAAADNSECATYLGVLDSRTSCMLSALPCDLVSQIANDNPANPPDKSRTLGYFCLIPSACRVMLSCSKFLFV